MAEFFFSEDVSGGMSRTLLRKYFINTVFRIILSSFSEQPSVTALACSPLPKELSRGLQNKLILGKQMHEVPKNY